MSKSVGGESDMSIDSVAPSEESRSALSWEAAFAEERGALGLQPEEQPVALCLSGGGIRSATFGLGVLQGLAARKQIGGFHYLSVVSGGGYIGAWFAVWCARSSLREVEAELRRDGAGGPKAAEPEPVSRLRAFSNYLSPARGLSGDAFALAATLMRNLVLHLAIVLPLLGAVVLLPWLIHAGFREVAGLNYEARFGGGLVLILALAVAASTLAVPTRNGGAWALLDGPRNVARIAAMVLMIATCVLAGAVVWLDGSAGANWSLWPIGSGDWTIYPELELPTLFLIAYGLGWGVAVSIAGVRHLLLPGKFEPAPGVSPVDRPSRFRAWALRTLILNVITGLTAGLLVLAFDRMALDWSLRPTAMTAFSVPAVLLAFWLALTLRIGLGRKVSGEHVREWWARVSGGLLAGAVVWIGLCAWVFWVPPWILELPWLRSGWTTGAAGAGALGFSLLTAIIGYGSKNGAEVKRTADSLANMLGVRTLQLAALLSWGVLVTTLCFASAFALHRALPASSEFPVQKTSCSAASLLLPEMRLERTLLDKACARLASECPRTISGLRGVATICPAPPGAGGSPTPGSSAAEQPSGAKTPEGKAAEVDQGVVTEAWLAGLSPLSKAVSSHVGHRVEVPLSVYWAARYRDVAEHASVSTVMALLFGFLAVFGILSAFTGANAFSMAAMYGNRLTRAYLGASKSRSTSTPDPFTGFDPADNQALVTLFKSRSESGPMLVVNAALNLLRRAGGRLEWQQRKACSFTFTPLHCGAAALEILNGDHRGFRPTRFYAPNRKSSSVADLQADESISVGRAMAISGAAVAPSMGHHSSTLVSALLAVFNMRLGWWLPNPVKEVSIRRAEPALGAGAIVNELVSRVDASGEYIYLSDGGHFENLGIYEMLRRRCSLIVAVDAAHDPEYRFEDLENAVRKARVDLGAVIDIHPEVLRPNKEGRSSQRHAVGSITYGDGSSGKLVYIKPVLRGTEPLDIKGYARGSSRSGHAFPQQPTSDQFFDEAQFESYRRLGELTVEEVLVSGKWPDRPAVDPEPTTSPENGGGGPAPNRTDPDDPVGKPSDKAESTLGATGTVGSAGRLLDSLGTFGQTALLASVVTVTGVVTATGTVSLIDSSVRLDKSELTLQKPEPLILQLPESFAFPPLTVEGQPGGVAGGPQPSIDDLITRLDGWLASNRILVPDPEQFKQMSDGLANAATELTRAGAGTVETSRALAGSIEGLRQLVDRLDLEATKLAEFNGILSSIEGRLGEIEANTQAAAQYLEDISQDVSDISPRSSVSGGRSP